ncbi:MarR family winged helix-turn-helix transcriptional regulator [Abyssicoccus albus]|uniref:MarR family 2-MHQ and catechol resistance regulon transcriptional repressor n=1 Tax=Abyssicoccus albus TaxID=1817405 RepID=A0A3N5BYE0_9BACL|nr:MarR family transcriptional regulator [Abyssicoccus albus]RPF54828.1 MarR family 2-MHQ and catechol resistance regulon transcriptional repressor [Abyssicoccus albus]
MSEEKSLKSWVILSRAFHAVEKKTAEDIRQYGVSPTEFGVLELLYHKGKQPIQKIAQSILLTSGSMTYVIQKLEKEGYIRKSVCENDKRVTYIKLSTKGLLLIGEAFPKHAKAVNKIFENLTETEQVELQNLLKKVGKS